ncbi:MAG: 50S ribosomal protein L17 [Chloroflexota bacterium]|nr:50S ribosomal protein L17 [Chloroflexota bacterium]
MRHRVSGYKLGRNTGSRKALFRNLVAECIKRGKIRTTYAKAKAIQPKVEKIITLGRKGTLNDRRKAYSYLNDNNVLDELFLVISKRFEQRSSGFTRITKLGYRKGDSTHLVELSILGDLDSQSEQPEGSDE